MPEQDNIDRKAPSATPDTSSFLSPEEKAHSFLEQFRMESERVRELILKDIHATDTLARIGVMNYRELFLEYVARERDIPFNRFDPPLPACIHCGSISVASIADKENLYYCSDCRKKFAPNANSISSNAKVSLLTYAKLIHCILNYETVDRTCDICGITYNTYYRLRNHIYYAISVYLEKLSLFGEIQMDETYLNISYKGTSLRKSQFDEEDDRFAQTYKPRDRRSRGGSYSKSEANANKLCIFTAVDNRGFVHSCYAGIGIPSVRTLRKNVRTEKFSNTVPESFVFPYPLKEPLKTTLEPGSRSLLIFDGSSVLRKFAESVVKIDYYSRVYRRNGVQMKAPEKYKHLNVQRVNYVHRRLKEHIFKTGSGSSRYIKGTLLLFDFVMNTNAPRNKEAVDALLRILVQPGLGQNTSFYNNYFALPNHLFEWTSDDNALSKLPYPNVYAYSLYDRYKNPDRYPNADIPTLSVIQEECGLSLQTVRSTYRDYKAAGYHDRIISHFSRAVQSPETEKKQPQNSSYTYVPGIDIDAAALEIFDRRTVERTKPFRLRKSMAIICDEVNKEYHSKYVASGFHHYVRLIIEQGLREEPPDIVSADKFLNGYPVSEAAFFLLEQYDILADEARLQNKEPPGKSKIYDTLAQMFPEYTRSSILAMVSQARRYLRQQENPTEGAPHNDIIDEHIDKIYASYAEYRRTHWIDSEQELQFWNDICRRFHFNVTIEWLRIKMRRMSNEAKADGGVPLPDYLPQPRKKTLPDSALKVIETCSHIMREREEKGLAPLSRQEMIREIKKTTSLSEKSISTYLSEGKIAFPQQTAKSYSARTPEKERQTMELYDRIVQQYIDEGKPIPFDKDVAPLIQEELQLSVKTILNYIKRCRARRREGIDSPSADKEE